MKKKSKRKICIIISARPSYARIKSVLKEIKKRKNLELILILTASTLLDRYGNLINDVKKDGFKVNYKVHMLIEGGNLVTSAKSTGLSIIELSTLLDRLNPDVVLTIADRYETIATAISASYINIPIGHVQGGEITGSIDEKVRHAVTKLSNIHFVSNKTAYNRVIKMGEDPDSVFITGCPSIDLAAQVLENHQTPFNPIKKYGGVGSQIDLSQGYFVIMQHPVTTEYDLARVQVTEILKAVNNIKMPILWFWPNVDAGSDGISEGIRIFRENEKNKNIWFFKNMAPTDFLRLLYDSKGIIGNSSVAIRECSFLGVPAVNIGTRQNGRCRGKNIIDVECDRKAIRKAIENHLKNDKIPGEKIYGDGTAGEKIAKLLAEIDYNTEKMLFY